MIHNTQNEQSKHGFNLVTNFVSVFISSFHSFLIVSEMICGKTINKKKELQNKLTNKDLKHHSQDEVFVGA